MVPNPNGAAFFAPMPAARAMGAIIGMKRLRQMTMTVAISHGRLVGAGLGLSLRPQVSPRPSKPEPLLADADENSYIISENPWGPGLNSAFCPQLVAAKIPVGHRIMIG